MSPVQTSAASELLELLGQLVAIDSVNPTLIPGGAGEAAIARFVAECVTIVAWNVPLVFGVQAS